ncbi:MAG: hypothetical protein R2867_02070 [Caldilineaceae bacterium]
MIEPGVIQQWQAYLQELWDLYRVERRLPEIIELLNTAIAVIGRANIAENGQANAVHGTACWAGLSHPWRI